MLKKKFLAVAVAVPAMLAVQQAGAATTDTQVSERIKQLEAQLRELQALVQEQGVEQQELSATLDKQSSSSSTTFNYGGFVKVDAMWNDYSDGERANAEIGDEILVPSVIPVGGDDGAARFDSHMKTSRIWLKTNSDTPHGDVKTHFELDLLTANGDERISNSANARIRHAYVSWDYSDSSSILIGQSWSTFMNTGALPEAVDFIGPTSGVIFNRQSQLRWTRKLSGTGSLQVSFENPSSGFLDAGYGIAGNDFDDNEIPDLVVKYQSALGNLNYSVAGLGRQITYDNGDRDESEFGMALSIAGKYTFDNGDDIRFQVNHGNLGRYLALQAFRDAGVEADGDIDLIEQTGGYIAYRHLWSDKLRSTLIYAMSSADNPDTVSDTNNESVSNYSVNLFYSPVKNLSVGVEYLIAERELVNGDKGELNRLQFTSKYVF